MAVNDLFTKDNVEVDFKEFEKIRLKAVQNDTLILNFTVFNNNQPVTLSDYNIEFRANLPNGEIYSEENAISINGNELKITCDSTVTQAVGEVNATLRLWTKDEKQTSLYKIIIRVLSVGGSNTVSKSTISALEHLDISINRAIDLTKTFDKDMNTIVKASEKASDLIETLNDNNNKLKQTIEKGENTQKNLDGKISDAENEIVKFKTAIDEKITQANTAKGNLENVYSTANDWLSKLDEKNNISKQNCDLLDSKNERAETNKSSLDTAISEAEEKLEEFKMLDTRDIVVNNNTMLSELICKNELCTLIHTSTKQYPIVQMLYYKDGFGMGGFGQGVAGGTAPECNLMQNKVIYLDDNTIRIFVPENNYIKNNSIQKHNDDEYLLVSTDTNDTRCILILFK